MKGRLFNCFRRKHGSRSPSPAGGLRQATTPHPVPSQSTPISTSATITPEPPAPPTPPATKDPIRTRIWNSAYDKVKQDKPDLVEAYERILSAQLCGEEPAPLDGGTANVIKQDADGRQRQMQQLIDEGLKKTERDSKIKEKINEGMRPIKNVKDIVSLAVKAEPTAAAAWVGITALMEIITNPVSEPGKNREGIKHVLNTVEWYWELSDLLDADGADEPTMNLQELLEKDIADLYKKLLMYQMQSVCLYRKHWAPVLVRDLFLVDDWQVKVDSIKKDEEAIREKITQHNSEVLKSRLACIDDKLGLLRLDVQATTSAVGEVGSAVKEQTRDLWDLHHDDKDKECLKDLYIVDPRTEKQRLEKTKGGLLKDSYRWILGNAEFREFRSEPNRRLLWINGDPGKGKTMLLCGIIDELEKESVCPLSYFFFQASQDDLRSSLSVLRGLLWLLCEQHPELTACVRDKYDVAGKKCFQDFFSLRAIMKSMLDKPCMQTAVLIVDALDECSYEKHDAVEREELIGLIMELSESCDAKWIVSSRNWPVIKEQLRLADKTAVSLELNQQAISRAVETFVHFKTDELARIKPYDEQTKKAVLERLLLGAKDTFLWVALACKELARPGVKSRDTLAKLGHLPSGLDDLYQRMLEQIATSEHKKLCLQILATACVTFRSLALDELRTFVPELEDYTSEDLRHLVGECGSFLTIQHDVVHFVHQSAKDFLVVNDEEGRIFPSRAHEQEQHRLLFRRSLEALKVLQQDIYGLKSPGAYIKDITPPDPDPLSPLKYATFYWVDHLEQLQGGRNTSDDELIDKFFREKSLYWLEALALQGLTGQGRDKIQRLKVIIRNSDVECLGDLVNDAWRFLSRYLRLISLVPLQLYSSALVFSPTESMIRQLFKHDEPSWLIMKPRAEQSWGSCVSAMKGAVISPSGKLCAEYFHDMITISKVDWSDIAYSITFCSPLATLEFAPNGEHLAVGLEKGVIKLLDTKIGRRVWELIGHENKIDALAFSPNGKLLASASSEVMILWDLGTGNWLRTFTCPHASQMSFSVDNQRLASGYRTGEMRLWDVTAGDCIWSIEAHKGAVGSLAFLSGEFLVSGSSDKTVKIWDLTKKACTQTLRTACDCPSVVSLEDGGRFAYLSGKHSETINISNERGICLQTISVERGSENLVFLPDLQFLATASCSKVTIWDLAPEPTVQAEQGSKSAVRELVLSCNGKYLASGSDDSPVRLWDTSAGAYDLRLEYAPWNEGLVQLKFSENGQLLISEFWCVVEGSIQVLVWDTANGKCLGKYEGPASLSPDDQQLASISPEGTVMIHQLSTGQCIQKIKAEAEGSIFLANGNRLICASGDKIEIWDTLQPKPIASQPSSAKMAGDILNVMLLDDSEMIAVLRGLDVVMIWDLATKEPRHELEAQPWELTLS